METISIPFQLVVLWHDAAGELYEYHSQWQCATGLRLTMLRYDRRGSGSDRCSGIPFSLFKSRPVGLQLAVLRYGPAAVGEGWVDWKTQISSWRDSLRKPNFSNGAEVDIDAIVDKISRRCAEGDGNEK